MTNLGRNALLLILAFSCVSCIVGTQEDVSRDPRFSQHLGDVYMSTIDLHAVGITLDQNYRTGIDVIKLYPHGLSGPEVKGHDIVKAGAKLRVVAVTQLRFTSFWSDGYSFVVEGAECSICSQAKVTVDVKELDDRLIVPEHLSPAQ